MRARRCRSLRVSGGCFRRWRGRGGRDAGAGVASFGAGAGSCGAGGGAGGGCGGMSSFGGSAVSFTGSSSTAPTASSTSAPRRFAAFLAAACLGGISPGSFCMALPSFCEVESFPRGSSGYPSASPISMPDASYLSRTPQGRCGARASKSSPRRWSTSTTMSRTRPNVGSAASARVSPEATGAPFWPENMISARCWSVRGSTAARTSSVASSWPASG
eukprot:6772634-Prymnesium_polylepis.1